MGDFFGFGSDCCFGFMHECCIAIMREDTQMKNDHNTVL